MEKTMSIEERIRRAEQIYNRRNNSNYTYQKNTNLNPKKGIISRLLRQFLICSLVYLCFYVGNNREYFLSEEFKEKVENIASQTEITQNGYNIIKKNWNKYFNKSDVNIENDKKMESNNDDSLKIENEDIGGSTEEVNINTAPIDLENESTNKTQEEKDIEELKTSISFINPVDGIISSTFGWRTPTSTTVPKYHTGLDIAVPTGTIIKSATDGKIVLASNEGDYGKHYKIQVNDVVIIYAHCSKLYYNEGEEIKQGDCIAEVGSTGNSTRTTSTFRNKKTKPFN